MRRSAPRKLIVIVLLPVLVRADLVTPDEDGWYTWQVTAAANAPDWCCYSGNRSRYYGRGCQLDNMNSGFSSFSEDDSTVTGIQMYVQQKNGQLQQIRAYGSQCPVQSDQAIIDLGEVDSSDSVRWLQNAMMIQPGQSPGALAAISVHDGPEALSHLLHIAARGELLSQRKDAVFWLAQVRPGESADAVEDMMFDDPDPEFREHAAFALSESRVPGRIAALTRLGREDDSSEVRSQAWFWLAQTESPQAEAAIRTAIENDASSKVREQAIFALSQLPEQRAATALVTVVEDRNLEKRQRKQALFWLAQMDSEIAMDYLERLFSRN